MTIDFTLHHDFLSKPTQGNNKKILVLFEQQLTTELFDHFFVEKYYKIYYKMIWNSRRDIKWKYFFGSTDAFNVKGMLNLIPMT